jgi:hypothetical protein
VLRKVRVSFASFLLNYVDSVRDRLLQRAVKVIARHATLEERLAIVHRRLASGHVVAVIPVPSVPDKAVVSTPNGDPTFMQPGKGIA